MLGNARSNYKTCEKQKGQVGFLLLVKISAIFRTIWITSLFSRKANSASIKSKAFHCNMRTAASHSARHPWLPRQCPRRGD